MKINNFQRIQSAYQSYSKQVEKVKATNSTKQSAYEHVELSSEAQQQLKKEREAKINELKNQVANGTYKMDSEKIAEKLLSSWENGGKVVE